MNNQKNILLKKDKHKPWLVFSVAIAVIALLVLILYSPARETLFGKAGEIIPPPVSWGAVRSVSENDVTIMVNTMGTTGYIIKEIVPSGLVVTSVGQNGYIGKGYIQWTFLTNSYTILTYSTTGSGTVSGVMTAGDPPSEKTITGETYIPRIQAEICNNGINDDKGDSLIDCADPDCVGQPGPTGKTCCQAGTDCPSGICESYTCEECASGSTRGCATGLPGVCSAGFQTCQAGVWGVCLQRTLSSPEICDNLDNDCDGQVDEGFDLLTDPQNCGLCGKYCLANETCQNGACCEAAETCDGLDNDCDGLVDEDFDLLSDPKNCGSCGKYCLADQSCQKGVCVQLVEICGDTLDNDNDGLINCDDPDCIGQPSGKTTCCRADGDCLVANAVCLNNICEFCTDTDEGANYYVQGSVSDFWQGKATDYCSNEITLVEYVCTYQRVFDSRTYSCLLEDKVCQNGACVQVLESCSNGVDDNFNGLIDCADPDCTADPVCCPSADWTNVCCLLTNVQFMDFINAQNREETGYSNIQFMGFINAQNKGLSLC